MRSGMKRKYHVPFWRAAALVRESLTLMKGGAVVVDSLTATTSKKVLRILSGAARPRELTGYLRSLH